MKWENAPGLLFADRDPYTKFFIALGKPNVLEVVYTVGSDLKYKKLAQNGRVQVLKKIAYHVKPR